MMRPKYLALLGPGLDAIAQHGLQATMLERLGLRLIAGNEHYRLLTSDDTPALQLPDGQLLLGNLFDDLGRSIEGVPSWLDGLQPHEIRAQLISRCWGEYVLFQPDLIGGPNAFVMRDPSGGIPCFYSAGGRVPQLVTSDISIAVALGLLAREVDWDFVGQALAHPNARSGTTGLQGVHELLPGRVLELRRGTTSTSEAWSPWAHLSSPSRHDDLDEAARAIRDAVECVVGAWAEIDRAVLMELSGGLDSSIVAACLGGTAADVTFHTVSTPVPGGDERTYAQEVTNLLGAQLTHDVLAFESATFAPPVPPSAVMPCVGPLQHAVDVVMSARATSHGVESHFCGAGGDTVFGGRSNASPVVNALRSGQLHAGAAAVHDIATLHQCTVWRAARSSARKLMQADHVQPHPDVSFLRPLATAPIALHPWACGPRGALPGDRERAADLAGTQMFRDDAQRAERPMRMPLLSQPVVEACLRVPSWLQVRGGNSRAVARHAFRDRLPAAVHDRRSKGTFLAYMGAVYNRDKDEMLRFLADGHLEARGLLDIPAIQRYIASPAPPRDRAFARIFELCMIENWVRHQA